MERARLPAYIPRQGSFERPTEERWAEIGVMPKIEATGTPTRRGYYTATEDAIAAYRFPVGDPVGYSRMVRRLTLDPILANHAGSLPAVELRMGLSASELLWDGDRVVGVRLAEHGRVYEERARLIVGADGVHSTVRELVFGPSFVRYLGHHVAAFSFQDASLAARIGYRYQMLTVPERMIGCYAVRDGAMAALMLYRSSSPELPADPAAELRSRFGDLGWVAPSLLSVVPDDVYYDEVSQVDMPSWHRGKVVLVGDACGAVSLFAGHGASLAMTGAFVLAEELSGGVEGAFERYQARMKPAVEHTQAFGQRFIGWMAPRSRWRISVRDMAFRLSGLPVVRNLIRGSVMPDVDGVLRSA